MTVTLTRSTVTAGQMFHVDSGSLHHIENIGTCTTSRKFDLDAAGRRRAPVTTRLEYSATVDVFDVPGGRVLVRWMASSGAPWPDRCREGVRDAVFRDFVDECVARWTSRGIGWRPDRRGSFGTQGRGPRQGDGRAVYTADVTMPGICYAVMVQADVPHGRITADSLRHATEIAPPLRESCGDDPTELPAAARAADGADLRPAAGTSAAAVGPHACNTSVSTWRWSSPTRSSRPPYAASLIELDYQPLPAQLSRAGRAGQPVPADEQDGQIRHGTYQPDHFVKLDEEKLQDRRGAARRTRTGIKVAARFTTPINAHYPIELSATIAALGRRRAHRARQHPVDHRRAHAHSPPTSDMPEDNVRILAPLVGGAFGSKSFLWMHVALCAVAAREVRRPVKLVLTRNQMFSLDRAPAAHRAAAGAGGRRRRQRSSAPNSTP